MTIVSVSPSHSQTTPFLTARWEYLAMLNYTVDSALLLPRLPRGTVLDDWKGLHTVSLVAFLFKDTCVCGFKVPWHINFEEVNLRFYVKYLHQGVWRRGVVFINEIVPRFCIALVARLLYNEPYRCARMSHALTWNDSQLKQVSYSWGRGAGTCSLVADIKGDIEPLKADSEEEFITEHYWGYTRQRDGSTIEYPVEHPRWRIWSDISVTLGGEFDAVYSQPFADMLRAPPRSSFIAEGSAIKVFRGMRI